LLAHKAFYEVFGHEASYALVNAAMLTERECGVSLQQYQLGAPAMEGTSETQKYREISELSAYHKLKPGYLNNLLVQVRFQSRLKPDGKWIASQEAIEKKYCQVMRTGKGNWNGDYIRWHVDFIRRILGEHSQAAAD